MDSTRPGRLPGSAHGEGPPNSFFDVGQGDEAAVDTVERWFLDYQATGDPAVRERTGCPPGLLDGLSWSARRWSW